MIEKKKLNLFKRWAFLIFFVFLFLVLQSTEILTFFFNSKPMLVFPFAICCSLFLKKEEAAIFSFICGFFLDCYNNFIFGFSSAILLIFCTIISNIFKKYISICFFSVLLLNFSLFTIYSFLLFTFKYLFLEVENVFNVWLFSFVPNIIYTTISSLFIFFLSKKLCYNEKLHIKEPKQKFIRKKLTKEKRKKYGR